MFKLRIFKNNPNNPDLGTSAGTISEVPPSYDPRYPYNNAWATEAGHLIEVDDSPGAERIQVYHRTGSRVEMQPDGTVIVKSTKRRQDITIGDHDIVVQGDHNITIDGACKLYVRNGKLEIQADSGAAINVKGELAVHADDIFMRAKKKITLAAPNVDIGGAGPNGKIPYISLPAGIAPIFGVLVPRITGVFPKAGFAVPSLGGSAANMSPSASLTDAIKNLNGLARFTSQLATSIQGVADFGSRAGLQKSLALAKSLEDSNGEKLIPEIEQPDEIPLASPRTYAGITPERVLFRDRQFDTPDDVDDAVSYTAHLNICAELKDFTADAKELPGQTFESDETLPGAEPHPVLSFPLDAGTVSVTANSVIVTGTDTEFTEELTVGQILIVNGEERKIVAVADNTTAIVETAFTTSFSGSASVYRLRGFDEFSGRYDFDTATRLGDSGLSLADLMVNYVPPIVEKESASGSASVFAATMKGAFTQNDCTLYGDGHSETSYASEDEIDPRSITYLHADVSSWAATSRILSVSVRPPDMCIQHSQAGEWPRTAVNTDLVEGNIWIVVKINDQWYAAAWDYLRPGQTCKSEYPAVLGRDKIGIAPLDASWAGPQSGDEVGVFMSTRAKDEVRCGNRRTNIKKVIWP